MLKLIEGAFYTTVNTFLHLNRPTADCNLSDTNLQMKKQYKHNETCLFDNTQKRYIRRDG